jgi:hypothetical protein
MHIGRAISSPAVRIPGPRVSRGVPHEGYHSEERPIGFYTAVIGSGMGRYRRAVGQRVGLAGRRRFLLGSRRWAAGDRWSARVRPDRRAGRRRRGRRPLRPGPRSTVGVPEHSIIHYEAALKADKYLVIAHSDAAEIERLVASWSASTQPPPRYSRRRKHLELGPASPSLRGAHHIPAGLPGECRDSCRCDCKSPRRPNGA